MSSPVLVIANSPQHKRTRAGDASHMSHLRMDWRHLTPIISSSGHRLSAWAQSQNRRTAKTARARANRMKNMQFFLFKRKTPTELPV